MGHKGQFKKGQSGNPNGRPKGSVTLDHAKTQIKNLRQELVDIVTTNIDNLQPWLDSIAKENPKDAYDMLLKTMDFCIPKIQRVEQQTLDRDGEPTDPAEDLLAWIAKKNNGIQDIVNSNNE